MKQGLLAILAILPVLLSAGLEYTAPEFIQPYYEAFTKNYINAEAAGRGYTAVSASGGIQNVILNPAAWDADGTVFHLELFVKVPTDELNALDDETYNPTLPLGMFAAGFSPVERLGIGFSVHNAYSIEYESFDRKPMGSSFVVRHPSLDVTDFTLTMNWKWNDLTLGVNNILTWYRQQDYRKYYVWDKLSTNDWVYRLRFGARWTWRSLAFGAAWMPETNKVFTMSDADPSQTENFEEYDTTLPGVLSAGINASYKSWRFWAETDWEGTSAQSDAYDDRLRLKFGIERTYDRFIVRTGLISNPDVWNGTYDIPQEKPMAPEAQNDLYVPEYTYGEIPSTSQLLFTGGVTYSLTPGDLHLSFLTDLAGEAAMTQVFLAMTFPYERLMKVVPIRK